MLTALAEKKTGLFQGLDWDGARCWEGRGVGEGWWLEMLGPDRWICCWGCLDASDPALWVGWMIYGHPEGSVCKYFKP